MSPFHLSTTEVLTSAFRPIEGVNWLKNDARGKALCRDVFSCLTCGVKQGTKGASLKQCKGCLRYGFCSKACQRKLWPIYRQECNSVQVVKNLFEILRIFCLESLCLHLIRVTIILDLDLLNPCSRARLGLADQIEIPYLSLRLSDNPFFDLYRSTTTSGSPKIHPEEVTPNFGYIRALYQQAREEAKKNGRVAHPIVVVRFSYNTAFFPLAIEITPDAFVTATEGKIPAGVVSQAARRGDLSCPMTLETAYSYLSMWIEFYRATQILHIYYIQNE